MDYTYTNSEIEFARHIKLYSPQNIWWDFATYVFDYGDFYFQIECVSELAATQNKSDEAIIGRFSKHFQPFVPGGHMKLICQDKNIEELYIVRVLLYFTTYSEYSKTKLLLNQVKQRLKSLLTGKNDPVGELLSKSIGGCEEITCHPKSDDAKNVDPNYSNLIDCGLLVQIDGKYLKAFVERNGFGFDSWNDNFFLTIDEIKEISSRYELIKV